MNLRTQDDGVVLLNDLKRVSRRQPGCLENLLGNGQLMFCAHMDSHSGISSYLKFYLMDRQTVKPFIVIFLD